MSPFISIYFKDQTGLDGVGHSLIINESTVNSDKRNYAQLQAHSMTSRERRVIRLFLILLINPPATGGLFYGTC